MFESNFTHLAALHRPVHEPKLKQNIKTNSFDSAQTMNPYRLKFWQISWVVNKIDTATIRSEILTQNGGPCLIERNEKIIPLINV